MLVVMFSHFIGKLLPVGSLAYGALVLGTCPPLAAEIVEQSLEHRVLMVP